MSKTIDARGLTCPQPVVLARKALEEADDVTVIVDNETARENICRLAASQGCEVHIEEKEGGVHLYLARAAGLNESEVARVSASTLVLVASDRLGRGDEELGCILMRSFVYTLSEIIPGPERVIFINSGVKLVVEGSEVLDDLRALEDQGVEVLACGTCLGYYNLKEAVAVGRVSNMYDIVSALMQAGRIIAV